MRLVWVLCTSSAGEQLAVNLLSPERNPNQRPTQPWQTGVSAMTLGASSQYPTAFHSFPFSSRCVLLSAPFLVRDGPRVPHAALYPPTSANCTAAHQDEAGGYQSPGSRVQPKVADSQHQRPHKSHKPKDGRGWTGVTVSDQDQKGAAARLPSRRLPVLTHHQASVQRPWLGRETECE